LDYAIPDYRDLKNARFIYFAQSNHFSKKGYKILKTESNVKQHQKYLRKIGFIANAEQPDLFVKNI
jgi:hypothetical protein